MIKALTGKPEARSEEGFGELTRMKSTNCQSADGKSHDNDATTR